MSVATNYSWFTVHVVNYTPSGKEKKIYSILFMFCINNTVFVSKLFYNVSINNIVVANVTLPWGGWTLQVLIQTQYC